MVLNRLAKSVVDEMRDVHDEFRFAYKGGRVQKRTSSAWRRARQKAGLPQVRVHDLKQTFGRRLRAPACRSRIGRTCSATARDGSRRTTRRRSWATSSRPQIGRVRRGPAKVPHR